MQIVLSKLWNTVSFSCQPSLTRLAGNRVLHRARVRYLLWRSLVRVPLSMSSTAPVRPMRGRGRSSVHQRAGGDPPLARVDQAGLERYRDWALRALRLHPDIGYRQFLSRLQSDHGITASVGTIQRWLVRLRPHEGFTCFDRASWDL